MKINLSKKIGAFVGLIVLCVSLSIGLVSLIYSSNAILQTQKDDMLKISDEGAHRVQAIVDMHLKVLGEIAQRDTITTMFWGMQKSSLTPDVERLGYLDMAIVTPDGAANYVVSGETSQLGDREYIQKALNGESNVSDVLISKVTNSPVIMYAVPIEQHGKVVGALIARRDGTALNDITDELGIGERGYAFIVGADSTFYSHPNRDLVLGQVNVFTQIEENGPLKDFGIALKNLGTEKAGILNYNYDGANRLTAMSPIPGTNWTLGIGNYESDILAPMNNLRTLIFGFTIVILILGIAAGIIVGMFIAKPIKRLSIIINKMAEYDLSYTTTKSDQKILKRGDEIGAISVAVSSMIENIKNLVQTVAHNAEQVAASSEELTSTTQQSALASNEIARTIEEISKGATDQAQETEQGANNVNALSKLINKVQDYIDSLAGSISEVAELKDLGLEAIEDLGQKNKDSSEAAVNIREVIIETDKSADKIKTASNMIKSIAEQTNLLALNAAIEAARAGEAGKGFAVVADEIRELAEQSNRFTNEIDSVINELSDKTESSVKAIESVGSIMESQTLSVNNTTEKFNGISEAIGMIQTIIGKLNNASSVMEQKKEDIVATIENLSAISEENAAGTEEASASVEEQTASMEEIANASESLARLAEELQLEISKFTY
ncbi:methyl-accepting chemotaxis sensory transducer with Cache sensor [Mobilisporobacter senegalensis]|uniref:Methyl-accepting chemotaxis sensory transducer with Cache sensor n=1 Tax=Mobilisporobacter senegalensis TaxID=1329262 RepID=A0A3N1XYY3_9FIRM|nr:methyl-accepting chemotaxis protein [Mobilisporobacter senegalensis]ROR31816.1 methyl-accepting chemotaxis sensory transducer with Cache sensor [Mobilisporobacter senegalensis]